MTTSVAVTRQLPPDDVTAVLALVTAADDTDGASPLSEHALLAVRHGDGAPAAHLLVRGGTGVVGYAHVDLSDPAAGAVAELTVHPLHRRHGVGRALLRAAMGVADDDSAGLLRVWAHGDHPSASALALSLGFSRARVLLQMRRPLTGPPPAPAEPDGIRLRAFEPGRDDEPWVRLNGRAFADHPEQGRWTLADLRVRLAEPWFDPAGFLLAERTSDGALVGFHWTKAHPAAAGHQPVGEVYVLGVDPSTHGTGLGVALTLAGLRHLHGRGLTRVMLYVDESNPKAVGLYRKLGFAVLTTDVAYRRIIA